jgi:hypothetical protein
VDDEIITLRVGPAPSDVARAWIDNRTQLIAAAKRHPGFAHHSDVLELLDTHLVVWRQMATTSDIFDYRYDFRPDVLLLIGRYWFDLGQLTLEEREAMGAPLASDEVEAFTKVVVSGMVSALQQAGPEGVDLVKRLGL